MHTRINALPIAIDRKATIYGEGSDYYAVIPDENVILTTDGTNVEFWLSFIVDFTNPPLDALQIPLNMSNAEFVESTQGQDTFVDIILLKGGEVSVYIATEHETIYDEVHKLF